MNAGIIVYTCILGAKDNLRPPVPAEQSVRYFCYADEPLCCPPWTIQPSFLPYPDPHRNSRIPKILAHLHTDSDYSIWHDGCLQQHISSYEAVGRWLGDADLALFRHPCRSFWEEIEFCQEAGIGVADAVAASAADIPSGTGLWAGGVILRRHTQAVAAFNEMWWDLYRRGNGRDQFALAIAIHRSGMKVQTIDADILGNRDWEFHFHAGPGFDHLKDQPRFVPDRQHRAGRLDKLKGLCT